MKTYFYSKKQNSSSEKKSETTPVYNYSRSEKPVIVNSKSSDIPSQFKLKATAPSIPVNTLPSDILDSPSQKSNKLPEASVDTVVRIVCETEPHKVDKPWTFEGTSSLSSTGYAVKMPFGYKGEKEKEKVFIITNAHGLKDCVVDENGDRNVKMYKGKVNITGRYIGELAYCDIGFIELTGKNKDIFENNTTVFNEKPSRNINNLNIPLRGDSVTVLGYMLGYDAITRTTGSITRISSQPYVFFGDTGYTFSTDAAVNPGNSGGPVLDKQNKIMGMAFEGEGYGNTNIIPWRVVVVASYRFRQEAQKEKKNFYKIKPYVSNLDLQPLNMKSLRNYLKLDETLDNLKYNQGQNELGVRVVNTPYDNPTGDVLQSEDIIVGVDGHKLLSDATFLLKDNPFHLDSLNMFCTENDRTFDCDVLRKSGDEYKLISTKMQLEYPEEYISTALCDNVNEYCMLAGVSVVRMTAKGLQDIMQNNEMPIEPLYLAMTHNKNPNRKDCLMIKNIIPNKFNREYASLSNIIIKEVNGVKVNNLTDVVATANLTDSKNNGFLELKTMNNFMIVLDFSKENGGFLKTNKNLLAHMGVPTPGFNVDFLNDIRCKCEDSLSMMKFNKDSICCSSCNKDLASLKFNDNKLEVKAIENSFATDNYGLQHEAVKGSNGIAKNLINSGTLLKDAESVGDDFGKEEPPQMTTFSSKKSRGLFKNSPLISGSLQAYDSLENNRSTPDLNSPSLGEQLRNCRLQSKMMARKIISGKSTIYKNGGAEQIDPETVLSE